MGLVVDPSFVPPAPPTAVVSADQRLSALLDAAHSGVTLKADLTERVLRTQLHLNPAWRVTSALTEIRRNYVWNPRFVTNANWTGVGDGGVPTAQSIYSNNVAAVAGDTWTAGIDITAPAGASVTASIAPRGTTGGAFSTIPYTPSAFITIPAGTTQRITQTAAVGAGGDGIRFYLQISSGLVAGIVLSNPTLEKGAYTDLGPLHGAMAPVDGLTFTWAGAADASESVASGAAGGYGSPFQNYTGTPGAVGWTNGETFRVLLKRAVNGGIVAFSAVSGQAPIAVGDMRSGRFTVRQVGGAATAYIAPRLFSYDPTPRATDTLAITTQDAAGLPVAPDATVDVEVATAQAPATVAGTTRWIIYSRNTIAAGTVLEFSDVLLVAGGTPGSVFDGSTPATDAGIEYRWTGDPDASSSQEFVPAVVDGSGELPAFVRFLRGDQLVRSGDPARAPGGVAVAYDHEAPLGAAATWTAVAVFVDGTEGDPVHPVSMLVPEDLARVDDVWVKSTTDPTLSVRATVVALPELSLGGRAEFTRVPGDAHPSSSWDVHDAPATTLSVLTSTRAERAALEALLDSGPLLLQSVSAVDLEDLHFLPGDVSWRWTDGSREPGREWSVEVTAIERPATVDAPLRIPDRTCADLLESYPSCGALAAQVATNLELLGVS